MRLVFLFALLLSFPVFAQNSATISGRIVSEADQQPLPFSEIVLSDAVSEEFISELLSDDAGRFVLEDVPRGNYLVRASGVGFEDTEVDLTVGLVNNILNLGDIALAARLEVEELVVIGSAIELEEGVRSFDLSDNFSSAGGSVMDAMKNMPGITVDQEGQVLLRGSDRVTILVDGKSSALTGHGNQSSSLDSIPSANIARVEIINNPSSRYDSNGLAGVINLVYEENRSLGWTGDVSFTAGIGALDRRRDDLPTELGSFSNNQKFTPAFNLNYGGDTFDYFLQGEVLIQDHLPNNEFTTRFFDNGDVRFSQVPENREQVRYIFNTGVDWAYSDTDTLTASFLVDYEDHTDIAEVPFIDGDSGDLLRFWFWREEEVTSLFNFTLDWNRQFAEPGHELGVSFQVSRAGEDESYFLNEESPVRVGTDETHLDAREWTIPLNIDYVRPLQSGRLELGSKIQRRVLPVDYEVVQGFESPIFDGLGEESEWNEDIFGGYVNYVFEQPKYGVEAGFRLEQTEVRYEVPDESVFYSEDDEYDYFRIFPNVRFTYNLNLDNVVSFHVNSRVDRPGEPELRVFPKFDDPELSKTGNPFLRPQFTDTFELAYQRFWNTGSAFVSVYHRDIEDTFERIYAPDTSNELFPVTHKIFQNTGDSTNDGIELTLSQDILPSWSLNTSVNWYNNDIDARTVEVAFPFVRDIDLVASDDTTWDLRINNQVSLPYRIEGQISYIYNAERNTSQGRALSRSSVDIGLNRPIWNDRGQVTFSVSDLFNQFGIREEIDVDGFTAEFENFFESQIVRLTVQYGL